MLFDCGLWKSWYEILFQIESGSYSGEENFNFSYKMVANKTKVECHIVET